VAVAGRLALALGGSRFAVHLLPAIAGAALVLITGFITHELGGGKIAAALAGALVLISPVYLLEDSFLSMNAFEAPLWMAMAYVILRLVKGADPKWWLIFGTLAGVSVLNKYTAVLFIAALVCGFLLTS